MNLPETIYLIRGEDDEFGPTHVWCEDPAPDEYCDPAEAVEYVRKDVHEKGLASVEALEAHYWWKLGMANARRLIKAKRATSNAALFMNLFGTGFGTGFGTARQRCREIGLDPDGNETSLSSMAPIQKSSARDSQ